jgi:D-glycero-alpha-D-manno-heptose-7-phosphate kinase
MILTKAPLRISLGGGGTDLPSYYSRFGSTFISAGISQYVYLAVHKNFSEEFILKYSDVERVADVASVKHPLVRECLRQVNQQQHLEIVSFADIPGGTGLGSSGSFTIALLKALYTAHGRLHTTASLAEDACSIEIDRLREPVGKQDQFAAAFGGINRFDIATDGKVTVTPVPMPPPARVELEERLCLFFTQQRRSASAVLRHQDEESKKVSPAAAAKSETNEMLENLHQTKALGLTSYDALCKGDLVAFARLMSEQWEQKRRRSPGSSNAAIDHAYELGMKHGAVGGKLIGAGGGGFLMFLAEDKRALRQAMAEAGLPEVRFRFDELGAQVVVNN